MAYTTKTKVDTMFGITMDATLFTDLLAAVKLYIDQYTGRTFESATGDYYYDGNGMNELFIDSVLDSGAVVSILNSDGTVDKVLTAGQANDYIFAPYNSPEKTSIILTGNGSFSRFPLGARRVKVTAPQGASTSVPADIQLVATRLVGQMATTASGGAKTSESLGDYSVSYRDPASIGSLAGEMGITTILDMHRDIEI